MILFFLRHGEAGHNYRSDFERELTDDGKRASKNVGKFCAILNIRFTHALVSPLVRAKQTVHFVLKKLPETPLTETEHLTPESDPQNLFDLLSTYANESKILLVTHEPFVSNCISTLITQDEIANVSMKTSSIACIETIGAPSRGNGRLLWLVNSNIIQHFL